MAEGGGGGGRVSDQTSIIFCGYVNFRETNGGISVYGGQSRIITKRLVITNNTLQNKKHQIML